MNDAPYTQPPAPGRFRAASAPDRKPRDAYFDVLKGFLVLVMVAHHVLEYFAGVDFPLIKYLDFVTGGFPFAAGFLPSFQLQSAPADHRLKTSRRLVTRGAKLLLLFIAVNSLIALMFHQSVQGKSFGLDAFFLNLRTIFLSGDKSLAAFVILVPIAYTLIASGFLLLSGCSPLVTCAIATAMVSYCTWEAHSPFNAYFLSMGLAGAAAGTVMAPSVVVSAARTKTQVLLMFGCAVYMLLITVLPRDNALLYATGIFFVLAAAYASAKILESYRPVFLCLVTLGRYSLLAYLAQIFFLQALAKGGPRQVMEWSLGLIPLILTSTFLCGLCFALDFLRRRDYRIGYAYRLIFA
jgi:hypothetical protein